MRLVVSIVRPYLAPNAVAGGALSMEDLVQEGSLGLLKAVGRFNPERGHRFSTYATFWVRAALRRHLQEQSRTIRVPSRVQDTYSKIKRAESALLARSGQVSSK